MENTTYIIFIKAPINLYKTYPQCARRGEKGIHVKGKSAMLAKVAELKANGTPIIRVLTGLGTYVNI